MSDEVVETTGFGPCSDWATLEEARECGNCTDDNTFSNELLSSKLLAAQEVLYILSGRQFPGVCSDVVRPVGHCSCRIRRLCECGGVSRISLGGSPIISIQEVKVDGEILDEDEYRIDDSRYIARLPDLNGRRQGWPCCQDMALATTELRTFQVAFTYGKNPPATGKSACIDLACELARSCVPDQECALDRRITSMNRQGVSIQIPGLVDILKEGRTGIPTVDLFLYTFNPQKMRRESIVLIPENMNKVRRTS